MTRSRVSPDGRIAQRDVASKLVVIMVGLPARGKSYITKKVQRYLSWQQHEARIFNVGNRRRIVARSAPGATSPLGSPSRSPHRQGSDTSRHPESMAEVIHSPVQAAHILLNGNAAVPLNDQSSPKLPAVSSSGEAAEAEFMEQSAGFFDPSNAKASQIRTQLALSTLDELLDFLLEQGGSVGILDATNSTIERRRLLFNHIKAREPKLGILFLESVCEDKNVSSERFRRSVNIAANYRHSS